MPSPLIMLLAILLLSDEPTAEMRRPAAISVQSVPAIPMTLVNRLHQFEDVRNASFNDWAPDGNGILIGTRFGNTNQLHQVYVPGGRREQITFFTEPVTGRFLPGKDAKHILYLMSEGGNENNQIYLLDRGTGESSRLTDGKSRNLLGPARPDGSALIVHNNERNGRDTDMYLLRPMDATKTLLFETAGEFWTASDWSTDGTRLLLNRYVSATESYPAIYDIATRSHRLLPRPTDKPAAYAQLKFSPDGRFAYLSTDARGEFRQLARLDLDKGTYEWLTDDIPWDVDEIEVDPMSGLVAFTTNEEGYNKLYLQRPGGRTEVELPRGIMGGLKFSPDGSQLGFTLARPDAPADAYSITVADGKLTRWTYSEVGGLDPALFVSPELIRFKSFDGRMIPAFYYRPRHVDGKPVAVLISIHGGPESQYRPAFSGFFQYCLSELGIAVIAPNVRGSAGYGKTYLELDNGPRREDSVQDIGGLLDWIARQPELDANRVAVMGGSYGGYMVLASLVNFGDRIRAGVDIVGIANFITFLERTSPYRQDLRRAEYGDERDPEMRTVFERINPSGRAGAIKSALLVAHGTNDPRVPFFEAEQIATKVAEVGRDVWTVYADNEGHGFAKKDNREYLDAVIALFLRENLATK